jgi:hypothetical protein
LSSFTCVLDGLVPGRMVTLQLPYFTPFDGYATQVLPLGPTVPPALRALEMRQAS